MVITTTTTIISIIVAIIIIITSHNVHVTRVQQRSGVVHAATHTHDGLILQSLHNTRQRLALVIAQTQL